ncbi:hypothetical protein EY643_02905 [Halioglobus maricola]|uniref:HAD family hydrolase n=1 Tax=Halioglobus maricola TaxID=2601894 RepID=A0A5P9NFV9_9GAMM|nr:hypothetical protein [Halioglobus maricola]QFU74687.1 hypothetical protein EY643_02905 [Halioglobus maricola]
MLQRIVFAIERYLARDDTPEGKAIYSYDVFDTCVCRPYLEPQDLFYDLARNYAAESASEWHAGDINRLAQLRIEAEKQVRRANIHGRDITLGDIYVQLGSLSSAEIDCESLRELEIELEIASAYPICRASRQLSAARNGAKVIFASDMYLPEASIRAILLKCHLIEDGQALYVSNRFDKNKVTTALYHEIASREGVETGDIIHCGDNFFSDVHRARRAGLSARWVRWIQPNRYEIAAARGAERSQRNAVGLNRCVRLQLASSEADAVLCPQQFIYSVAAPFLTAFVAWVMRRARLDRTRRLYFVSRDGQILYKIACSLSQLFPDIEVEYLYGSRQAWFASSILACDESDTYWAYLEGMHLCPEAILERLGLTWQEAEVHLPHELASRRGEQLSQCELSELKECIHAGGLRPIVLWRAGELRSQVVKYLRQQGLFDGARWALVDVGWELNTQAALRRICFGEGFAGEVRGYYLGLFASHVRSQHAGKFSAYFAEDGSEADGVHSGSWLFDSQSRVVLEHLLTLADHGSVSGYCYLEHWEAVTGLPPDRKYLDYVSAYHEGVVRYVETLKSTSGHWQDDDAFMEVANRAFEKFMADPDPVDARIVAWLSVNIEQSHDSRYAKPLAHPLGLGDLGAMVASDLMPGRSSYKGQTHCWLAGSAAISSSPIRLLFKLLRHTRRRLHCSN